MWRMQPLFYPAGVTARHPKCAQAVTQLLSTAAVTGLRPGVQALVETLERLYRAEEPPPVEMIRHPRVSRGIPGQDQGLGQLA